MKQIVFEKKLKRTIVSLKAKGREKTTLLM